MDTCDTTTLPLPSFSLETLEHQITELAAHIHAANYRLLCLIAEFDRREGWFQWGILSCAHWLNWKCGIGLGAARDKVRVARNLGSLPNISEAFRTGQVSYSKVRAMTRVATPENEHYLLNIARHGTAAHVERLVCNYRKVQRIAERQRANTLHEERCVKFHHDTDGALVLEARLPPETGAIVLEALAAAGEAMYVRRRDLDAAEQVEARRKNSAESSLSESLTGRQLQTSRSAQWTNQFFLLIAEMNLAVSISSTCLDSRSTRPSLRHGHSLRSNRFSRLSTVTCCQTSSSLRWRSHTPVLPPPSSWATLPSLMVKVMAGTGIPSTCRVIIVPSTTSARAGDRKKK